MFYHINAFKQTEQKKYQLDFALEGDFDVIKERLQEKEIITLNISEINQNELLNIGTIHVTIFHQEDQKEHKLITHHDNIAQACLLLVFFGFDVRAITDTKKPLTPEQSNQLIALVHKKIQEKKAQKTTQETEEEVENKQFQDERLIKLKTIAQEVQNDINTLKIKAKNHIKPEQLKTIETNQNILQKYARGTNANKISTTLKNLFNIMEDIELAMIEETKEEEIHLIKDSLISNVDILNEYNKRQKAEQIKEVGEKSTDRDDKYYLFLGKIGIYTRFLQKEFLHKIAQGNFITKAIVTIIHHISLILPVCYALMVLWQTNENTRNNTLLTASHIAIYSIIWTITYRITRPKSALTLMLIPVVVGVGYLLSILIYNTFAL